MRNSPEQQQSRRRFASSSWTTTKSATVVSIILFIYAFGHQIYRVAQIFREMQENHKRVLYPSLNESNNHHNMQQQQQQQRELEEIPLHNLNNAAAFNRSVSETPERVRLRTIFNKVRGLSSMQRHNYLLQKRSAISTSSLSSLVQLKQGKKKVLVYQVWHKERMEFRLEPPSAPWVTKSSRSVENQLNKVAG